MLKIYENKIVNNAKFLQTLGMTDEFLRFLKESNSYFSWKKLCMKSVHHFTSSIQSYHVNFGKSTVSALSGDNQFIMV